MLLPPWWTAKPLGGAIFYMSSLLRNTKSVGQALRVSLVKPGAYLSARYVLLRGLDVLLYSGMMEVLQSKHDTNSIHRHQRFTELRGNLHGSNASQVTL